MYFANEYYMKLTQNFKPAAFPPCSVQSNTEYSNTKHMPYSQKISDRAMKEKCLAGWP